MTDRRRVEQRHRALIEHSSDLTTVLDTDGRFQYVSPSAERLLGFPPSYFEDDDAFQLVLEDDRGRLLEEFERVLSDASYRSRFEFRLRDADDDVRVFEAIGRNLLTNPFVEGIVVNSWDITDRKRREQELQRTNERLEEFASLLSHDLRNPLAVARGNVELAREGETEALAKVDDAHQRIERLIEDVLVLARDGRSVEETTTVDLDSVATEAWSNVRTADASLTVVDTVTFSADRDRLARLFENLFRNAVEHGSTSPDSQAQEDAVEHGSTSQERSGVSVRVGVLSDRRSSADSRITGFFVEDDGPGIPEEHRDDVFEYGYSSSPDGTGFGLAIVRRITEAHGWSLSLDEGPDGGTRFAFGELERRSDLTASTD
ncbi:PAS domain-containing sensor histidine kinase [Haloarculaceae archaeon H-GB2-1]|nr:PAS domain-containing sensor histidine kinase [Haloarculaceae archaeon H-GB11]MEA5407326.1 PAS domain-containing sensor histidine kinase [Haloarculaceae archaeon H-GB2-1]